MERLKNTFSDWKLAATGASLTIALLFQISGAVTMWLHVSNEPVILGRYDLDYFMMMVVYHAGVLGWAALTCSWFLAGRGGNRGAVGRIISRVANHGWLALSLLVMLWTGLVAALGYHVFWARVVHWIVLVALWVTAGLITLILFEARNYEIMGLHPYQYLPVAASILTILMVGVRQIAIVRQPYRYGLLVLEDGPVEWLTVGVFLVAGSLSLMLAARMKQGRRSFWFLLGAGLLCICIGAEEISWGQRLLGISTPGVLAVLNQQNEFNLHNILPRLISITVRQVFVGVVVGYGIILPVLAQLKPVGRFVERHNVIHPSLAMLPLFLIIAPLAYIDYASGGDEELAEMIFGVGFLLTVIARTSQMTVTGYFTRSEEEQALST